MAEDLVQRFQQAADVRKLGFAEFTTDLITDTADALVASTIKQLKSFSELIKELASGLTAFQEKNAGPQAVNQFLLLQFPNADGTATAIVAEGEYGLALFNAIVDVLGPIAGLAAPEEDSTETFTEDNVAAIQAAARSLLMDRAEQAFEQLENLVRIGYARVIFSNGHILTRLKFNVTASESEATQSSRRTTSSRSFGGGASGGLFGLPFLGVARLGLGGRTSKITVESVNTQAFEAINLNANILGEVRVDFRTETFDLEKLKLTARPAAAPAPDVT